MIPSYISPDLINSLDSDDAIAAYIASAIRGHDPHLFLSALDAVSQALKQRAERRRHPPRRGHRDAHAG